MRMRVGSARARPMMTSSFISSEESFEAFSRFSCLSSTVFTSLYNNTIRKLSNRMAAYFQGKVKGNKKAETFGEKTYPVSGLDWCPGCHAERSEASLRPSSQTLRGAKGDSQYLQMSQKSPCILNTGYGGLIRWRQFRALEDIGKNLTDLAAKAW